MNIVGCLYCLSRNPGPLAIVCSIISLLASFMAIAGAGGMLLGSLCKIARGITANEDLRDKWKGKNPYDRGCLRNFKNFCCKEIGPSILEIANYHSKNRLIC